MAIRLRSVAKRFFLLLNIVVCLSFLLACLNSYVNTGAWWLFSILGLGFVFLLIGVLAFVVFWLLALKPKYVFISILSLLLGYKAIMLFFSFGSGSTFNMKKDANALRVAHWNVARFIEWKRNNNKGSQTRLKMMEQIKEQNADILCMEEFFQSSDSEHYDNIDYIQKKLGYPYYYFSWNDDGWKQWTGEIIFSKLPLIDTGLVHYPYPDASESLIYADVVHNDDTIRIYTTHLQSFKFMKDDYKRIEKIKNTEDSMINNSKSIFFKVKKANAIRTVQADIVKEMIQRSPYPYILTLDMNDIPNSSTYTTIRGGLKDVFLEKGFGVGRTFNSISPTLRIDYVFTTKEFQPLQLNRIVKDLSDHYMLVTDLMYKK